MHNVYIYITCIYNIPYVTFACYILSSKTNHREELLHNQIKKKPHNNNIDYLKNNLVRPQGQDVAVGESHQGSKNN